MSRKHCKYCGTEYEYMTFNDEQGEVERHELCHNCGYTVDMAYGHGMDNTAWYEDALKYREILKFIEPDRLREMCAAERDGRVVVLPCKMGEPIWYIRRMCKHADDTGYCNTDFWYAKKGIKKESGCPNCPHKAIENRIKETVFWLALLDEKRVGHLHVSECYFTRAEAEAALRKLDGGGQDGC